jgi:hypothetical protein
MNPRCADHLPGPEPKEKGARAGKAPAISRTTALADEWLAHPQNQPRGRGTGALQEGWAKGLSSAACADERPLCSVSEGGLEPTSKIVVQASDLHVYRVADRGGSCCSPVVPRCPPLRTASVPNGNSPICNPRGDQVLPCMAVVPGSEGAHLGRRREMGRRALSAVSGAF